MNQHITVIVNPASGSADENFRETVEQALRERGAEYEIRETTPDLDAGVIAAEAVRDGAEHLMACGGDGTVMAVINGVGKSDHGAEANSTGPRATLSIVPGGTANLVAGALGLPAEPGDAVGVAVAGDDRLVDLGQCGEHLFALGLGLGLTERLVSQTSAQEKEKLGKLAYVKAMLREMGARPVGFTFKLDNQPEQTQRGVALVVANAGQIGGGLHFAPDAKMDDGRLDLCILHRFYVRDLVRMVWASLLGRLPEDRAISFYQARRIEIRSDPPLDLQIDGEEVDMVTPLIAEVLPGALRVRVPVPEDDADQPDSAIAEAGAATVEAARRNPLPAALLGVAALAGAVLLWRVLRRRR